MKKSVKEIWKTGKPEDLSNEQIVEIIQNLYDLKLAEAFFIGMGWIEGFHYCSNPAYLRLTFAPIAIEEYRRQIWFACKYFS